MPEAVIRIDRTCGQFPSTRGPALGSEIRGVPLIRMSIIERAQERLHIGLHEDCG